MGDFDDIADLVIPFDTLTFNGKSFKLYGLGLAEIVYIARHHGAALSPLYLAASSGKLPADATEIALHLAEDFGAVAATTIACGAGQPQMAQALSRLPFPVQIEALDKIIRLTIEGDGGLEKTMEIVVRALESVAKLTSRPQT